MGCSCSDEKKRPPEGVRHHADANVQNNDVYADAARWADSVDLRLAQEQQKREHETTVGPQDTPLRLASFGCHEGPLGNLRSPEGSRTSSSESDSTPRATRNATTMHPGRTTTAKKTRRPMMLPDQDGTCRPVEADVNPFMHEHGTVSLGTMVAAPIMVCIDGGGDEAEGAGTDSSGRLMPLDRERYSLMHIPSGIYPNATNIHPRSPSERSDGPSNFVTFSMPVHKEGAAEY